LVPVELEPPTPCELGHIDEPMASQFFLTHPDKRPHSVLIGVTQQGRVHFSGTGGSAIRARSESCVIKRIAGWSV